MQDLITPLSDEEYQRLDRFLLERIDEDADATDKDEGVLDVSELDGLFTAIVSGPVPVMPSQWLPAVWGDFEPVWEDEKALQEILSLMLRLASLCLCRRAPYNKPLNLTDSWPSWERGSAAS